MKKKKNFYNVFGIFDLTNFIVLYSMTYFLIFTGIDYCLKRQLETYNTPRYYFQKKKKINTTMKNYFFYSLSHYCDPLKIIFCHLNTVYLFKIKIRNKYT